MKKHLTSFIKVLCSTVFLLVLFEMICRLWSPIGLVRTDVSGSSNHLKKKNYYVLPQNSEWREKTSEYDVLYKTNSERLRDHNTYLNSPRDNDKTRVLLAGDSFSYGYANNYEDTWGYLLENRMPSLQIIKAGVPAFDQQKEYYYLEEMIQKYSPDIVLLGFLPNDIFTNVSIGSDINLDNTENAHKNNDFDIKEMIGKSASVALLTRQLLKIDSLYVNFYLNSSRGQFFESEELLNTHVRSKFEITKSLFGEINGLVKSSKSRLIVVSIPQRIQLLLEERAYPGYDRRLPDRIMSRYAAEEGFDWIESLPALMGLDKDPFYLFDGHLNKYGNHVLANHVKEILETLVHKQ